MGFGGDIVLAIGLCHVFAHSDQSLRLGADRVRSHVGDETGGAHVAEIDPFVKLLRERHGLLGAESELAGRFLLKPARDERRRRLASPFFLLDRRDCPRHTLEGGENRIDGCLVRQHGVLAVLLEVSGYDFDVALGEGPFQLPIFFRLEGLHFLLAIHYEPERNGLHSARGDPALDLVPQQRTDLVADKPIEDAPRLLGLEQVHIELGRVSDRFEDRRLRNGVEEDPVDLLPFGLKLFVDVPSDGFPFAIRVSGEVQYGDSLTCGAQLFDDLHLGGNDLIIRLEALLGVDAHLALREVFDVSDAGFDDVVAAQILLDRLGLRRRFHDDQSLLGLLSARGSAGLVVRILDCGLLGCGRFSHSLYPL